jgi:hypothetical protein
VAAGKNNNQDSLSVSVCIFWVFCSPFFASPPDTLKLFFYGILKCLENKINELKDGCVNDGQMTALNKLHDQLIRASNSETKSSDLSELLKSDDDILNEHTFEPCSYIWQEVREVQDLIIQAFGV